MWKNVFTPNLHNARNIMGGGGWSVVMAAAFVGLGGGKCEGVFIFIS
jgi:hypothetical protein